MRQRTFFLTVSTALVTAILALPSIAVALPPPASSVASEHVCASPAPGNAQCFAMVVTPSKNSANTATPTGLAPAQIKTVYNFPTSTSAGNSQTIGIVDAYNDPTAASDLNYFSNYYSLPLCSGCFRQVNQNGGTSLPRTNSGWALEISLDIEWAHAIAPGAKILLVEAKSASFSDLLTAERYAAANANYVSNSWGGSESSGETSYDSSFTSSSGKVSFFVSAGDSGLPAQYPSSSPNVISVGGTTLTFNTNGTLASETGWTSGGGGCSAYETANSAQSSFAQYQNDQCNGKRATPDVSLDADPSSGVSVYDTTTYQGNSGWWTVGGTSASSPMWAARSADQGVTVNAGYVYASNITFRDITTGGNTGGCQVGLDLCSGRGSWTN